MVIINIQDINEWWVNFEILPSINVGISLSLLKD